MSALLAPEDTIFTTTFRRRKARGFQGMDCEQLSKHDYCIVSVGVSVARELVVKHHYAKGGSNTATFSHGLFRHKDLLTCLGVAWWIPPTKDAAEATWDGDFREVLTLSRLVIAPGVPGNAASFLIARSVRLIAQDGRFRCLITYADEWQGHTGAIYRATNWEYLGLTTPEPTFTDETGRLRTRKAGGHTRTRTEMELDGCTMIGRFAKHKFRLILPPRRHGLKQGKFAI